MDTDKQTNNQRVIPEERKRQMKIQLDRQRKIQKDRDMYRQTERGHRGTICMDFAWFGK